MRRQKGFSLIELLIVVAILLIIAAIAVPNLLRARMSANDSAAASTVRTIASSNVTYLTNNQSVGYAAGLAALGPGVAPVDCTVAGNVGPNSACLIDAVVGCSLAGPCVKDGFLYYYTQGLAVAGVLTDYTVTAAPAGWQTSGTKNFCNNSDAVIRMNSPTTNPAGAGSQGPGLTATGCQTGFVPLQ